MRPGFFLSGVGVLGIAVLLLAACAEPEGAAVTTGITPAAEVQNPDAVVWLRAGGQLDSVAATLGDGFALDVPLRVEADTCSGEPNAYYEPAYTEAGRAPVPARIRLCVELVDWLQAFWRADVEDSLLTSAEAEAAVDGSLRFTLLHEASHALIDVFALPVVGREEDAADHLATLLLDDGTPAGADDALSGAEAFYEEPPDADSAVYWDEHGLGAQRFYNVVCLVYGRHPGAHADLVREDYLPQERADLCAEEYARTAAGWRRLLAPHARRSLF